MVSFLSLFLNLVCCTQAVEVAVDGPVAAVEIRLDDTTIATINGPPWRAECDLGAALRPHLLEAVAFDAHGKELARAEQRINVPRPAVEAQIVLDRDDAGLPRAARVVCASAIAAEARGISLRMDGLPIPSNGSGRFVLPPYDEQLVHLLSAEVVFEGLRSATAQASFGGSYGSDIRSDLTAVPLVFSRHEVPEADALQGLLRTGERELRVVAVEQPGVRLVAVQQSGALDRLANLAHMMDGRARLSFPRDLLLDVDADDLRLDTLSLMMPRPQIVSSRDQQVVVFPSLGPLTLTRKPLQWVITHASLRRPPRGPERIADAVAAAGVAAAATSRPRAVLLVLGKESVDKSQYTPQEVRAYLRKLSVPLVVWSVKGEAAVAGWGAAVDVSSPKEMATAAADLLAAVSRQHIVWVEGRLLPDRIELDPPAAGVDSYFGQSSGASPQSTTKSVQSAWPRLNSPSPVPLSTFDM